MAFDFNRFVESPITQIGLGLLSQPGSAPIGAGITQGLLMNEKLQNAKAERENSMQLREYQKGLLDMQKQNFALEQQKNQFAVDQMKRQELWSQMIGSGDIKGAMALFPSETAKLLKDSRVKSTWQDAGDKLIQIDETGQPTGQVMPKGQLPSQAQPRQPTEFEQYQANPEAFTRFKQSSAGSGDRPYYQFLPTPQGIAVGNARTGSIAMGGVDGKPIMRADSDPTLQGEISQARASGKIAGESTTKKELGAKRSLPVIAAAEELLDQATGSGVGAAVDAAGRLVGVSTKGATANSKLKALEGNLIMAMPRMEGPQSDKDTALYRQMAGNVGDATIPVAERKAALETIKALHEAYASPLESPIPKGSAGGKSIKDFWK